MLQQLAIFAVLAGVSDAAFAQGGTTASATEITIDRPPGVIAGTLLLPAAARPPLVILIAGSGPTNRDGNPAGMTSGPAPLRQLAESLAVRGIASLRYDKRALGGSRSSGLPERDLRFEMYADDAAAWIARFKKDARFSAVVVAGHSEGALLGLLALEKEPADGYISIAGPARSADSVLRRQLFEQLPAPLVAQSDSIIDALVQGRQVDSVPPMLGMLFRRSVQPYLISWFRYSARVELARWKGPCLIVQGTNDIQVAPSEADLLLAARSDCRLARIEGMNHLLKVSPAPRMEQMAAYTDPSIPLAPGLTDAIAAFVLLVAPRR